MAKWRVRTVTPGAIYSDYEVEAFTREEAVAFVRASRKNRDASLRFDEFDPEGSERIDSVEDPWTGQMWIPGDDDEIGLQY